MLGLAFACAVLAPAGLDSSSLAGDDPARSARNELKALSSTGQAATSISALQPAPAEVKTYDKQLEADLLARYVQPALKLDSERKPPAKHVSKPKKNQKKASFAKSAARLKASRPASKPKAVPKRKPKPKASETESVKPKEEMRAVASSVKKAPKLAGPKVDSQHFATGAAKFSGKTSTDATASVTKGAPETSSEQDAAEALAAQLSVQREEEEAEAAAEAEAAEKEAAEGRGKKDGRKKGAMELKGKAVQERKKKKVEERYQRQLEKKEKRDAAMETKADAAEAESEDAEANAEADAQVAAEVAHNAGAYRRRVHQPDAEAAEAGAEAADAAADAAENDEDVAVEVAAEVPADALVQDEGVSAEYQDDTGDYDLPDIFKYCANGYLYSEDDSPPGPYVSSKCVNQYNYFNSKMKKDTGLGKMFFNTSHAEPKLERKVTRSKPGAQYCCNVVERWPKSVGAEFLLHNPLPKDFLGLRRAIYMSNGNGCGEASRSTLVVHLRLGSTLSRNLARIMHTIGNESYTMAAQAARSAGATRAVIIAHPDNAVSTDEETKLGWKATYMVADVLGEVFGDDKVELNTEGKDDCDMTYMSTASMFIPDVDDLSEIVGRLIGRKQGKVFALKHAAGGACHTCRQIEFIQADKPEKFCVCKAEALPEDFLTKSVLTGAMKHLGRDADPLNNEFSTHFKAAMPNATVEANATTPVNAESDAKNDGADAKAAAKVAWAEKEWAKKMAEKAATEKAKADAKTRSDAEVMSAVKAAAAAKEAAEEVLARAEAKAKAMADANAWAPTNTTKDTAPAGPTEQEKEWWLRQHAGEQTTTTVDDYIAQHKLWFKRQPHSVGADANEVKPWHNKSWENAPEKEWWGDYTSGKATPKPEAESGGGSAKAPTAPKATNSGSSAKAEEQAAEQEEELEAEAPAAPKATNTGSSANAPAASKATSSGSSAKAPAAPKATNTGSSVKAPATPKATSTGSPAKAPAAHKATSTGESAKAKDSAPAHVVHPTKEEKEGWEEHNAAGAGAPAKGKAPARTTAADFDATGGEIPAAEKTGDEWEDRQREEAMKEEAVRAAARARADEEERLKAREVQRDLQQKRIRQKEYEEGLAKERYAAEVRQEIAHAKMAAEAASRRLEAASKKAEQEEAARVAREQDAADQERLKVLREEEEKARAALISSPPPPSAPPSPPPPSAPPPSSPPSLPPSSPPSLPPSSPPSLPTSLPPSSPPSPPPPSPSPSPPPPNKHQSFLMGNPLF